MATTVINVKYVNPAAAGKKNASIKTDDDQFFLVPPEMLGQFQQGGRYKIEYKANAFKGVTYKYVEKIEPDVAAGPSPIAKHQAGKYGSTDMATAERIFVCGAYNALMGNPNIDPRGISVDERIAEVNKNRDVWRQTLGNPQQDAEMNDEIPY
jgi:hypothetical protein